MLFNRTDVGASVFHPSLLRGEGCAFVELIDTRNPLTLTLSPEGRGKYRWRLLHPVASRG
ncbi:hypothetical protein GAY31_17790 [Azospirillum brasilense]|nr:hypothetical protein [Azospirillum brasilense]